MFRHPNMDAGREGSLRGDSDIAELCGFSFLG
jgi:hypothetical protein